MAFGRFDRSPVNTPMSEINVTPLVDVMLVLLVIFILTAPLLASAIRLDLPKSTAAQSADVPHFLTLVVDAKGQAFLNDQPVAADALQAKLQAEARRDPDTEIQLRADAHVPYGRVAEVIGQAQLAGLHRIGFVAKPE